MFILYRYIRILSWRSRGAARGTGGVLLENFGSSLLLGLGAAVLSWMGVRLIRNYAHTRQLSATLITTSVDPTHGGGLAILVVVVLIFMPVGLSLGDPGEEVRFSVSGA